MRARMTPFRELVTFERAKEIVLSAAAPITDTEAVPLERLRSRVLASDIVATMDVPGFSRAAMDGYAVRAKDTFGATRMSGKVLEPKGKVFAGEVSDDTVSEGTCIQIATGAPMPRGADAVVMVEETEVEEDGSVVIQRPVYPGANVSLPDSDIAKGTTVLSSGTFLDPSKVGVLASLGLTEAKVFRRPRVVLCPTGNEIRTPGEELGEGRIYDINTYTLDALLRMNGAETEIMPRSGDAPEELREMFRNAGGDILVFSGGSSVGERDLMAGILREMGEILFHGIALKPGKPTLFGRMGGMLVFGMPGYPTSCLTNGYVLLAPALRRMARLPEKDDTVNGIVGKRIVSTIGRHQILMVRLEGGQVFSVFKESGAITSMSRAHGYIEIPHNVEVLEEGTPVKVSLL